MFPRISFSFIDRTIIHFLQRIAPVLSRGALFTIFFWFGLLKVLGSSPASPLVTALLVRLFPGASPEAFLFYFGLFEMLIGMLFLLPGLERVAIALLVPHMISTALPLVFLPHLAWQGVAVPTLEGQYIIKNIALLALAAVIAATLHPIRDNR